MLESMKWLLVGLLAGVLAPAALAAAKPSVRLLVPAPATVVGQGFHPRERVLVTVQNGTAALHKTVRATLRGSFVARFAEAAPGGTCGQLVVTAVGARGDRAGWKSAPRVCGTEQQP
jgi:hypothetical protein